MRWREQRAVGLNVPLAGDKAEVEMSKQGIRALIISAVIGLFIWTALISALWELYQWSILHVNPLVSRLFG
ncbi:hypothetical protein A3N63_01825 [Klebsiella aerogenes]|nr:hypothetical protein A3N63_01825 [Klebsiella aerogenes]